MARARRRAGSPEEVSELLKAQATRDQQDLGRKQAPLSIAKSAKVINGGDMEFTEVVDEIEKYSREALGV